MKVWELNRVNPSLEETFSLLNLFIFYHLDAIIWHEICRKTLGKKNQKLSRVLVFYEMDKEWMYLPSRLVPEYEEGVQKFLAQARNYAKTREVILCPCRRCKNKKYMKFDQVYEHLIIKGFDPSYTIWFFHGESYTSRFQDEGSSGGVQEEEDESRETYHLYRDVFVPEKEEKSAKFKAMRIKQDHIHTMSRRGYTRLADMMEKTSPADTTITRSKVWIEGHKEKNGQPSSQAIGEKMKEIKECPPEFQNTTNIADDAISLVFGKEARGRVRRMDFGVTPSKVGASVQQNGTVKQLQSMVNNLQQEKQEMRSMFFQNMRQQNQQEQVASGGISSGIGNEVGDSSDINGAKKSGNIDNVKQHLATAQSNLNNVSRGDIRDNTKCKLLHWSIVGVVAEGRIASTDPKAKVHHVILGGSCWKVWVDRVFVEKVDLIRPNDEMLFLEDAIGSTIAWLSKFIVLYN